MMIENHTFAEIEIGAGAQLTRTVQAEDIALFAALSRDANPAYVDEDYARASVSQGIVAQGMFGAALISALIGTHYPGPGSIYLGQTLRFLQPVNIGDTLVVSVRVSAKDESNHHVTLECRCTNQFGTVVTDGEARVLASVVKVHRPRVPLRSITLLQDARPAGLSDLPMLCMAPPASL